MGCQCDDFACSGMAHDRARRLHPAKAMSLGKAIVLGILVLASGCTKHAQWPASGEPVGVSTVESAAVVRDPLPSWNRGPTRQAIIDFVTRVSTPGSPSIVPEQERIATFDNDGTLWPEQPLPEAAFTIAQLKLEVVGNPLLAAEEPYRSILDGDVNRLSSLGREAILSAIARTHSGMTDEAFEMTVHTFLLDARHPVFGVPYPSLAYRPMRELLAYLREHKFTIYLCTGDEQAFARAFAPATYGIPRDHIIGTTFAKEWVVEKGRGELRRKPEIVSLNDKEEKAVNIERYIGRRPILAAGNVRPGKIREGGDVAMLTYARGREGPSLALVVHHDDPERELAYDEPDGTTLQAASERGFVVISMRYDWAQVFDPPPGGRPTLPGAR